MRDDAIRDYVGDIKRRVVLRSALRLRFLIEVEDHLRDEAAKLEADGVAPAEAQRRAVEQFGPPSLVARAFAGELAARASFQAAATSFMLLLAFVAPLYAIPENAYPPAPWQTIPGSLHWKIELSVYAFAISVLAAAGAAVLTWWNRQRRASTAKRMYVALALLIASAIALAASAAAVVMAAVERVALDPATPHSVAYAIVIPFALATATAALALVARAAIYGALARVPHPT